VKTIEFDHASISDLIAALNWYWLSNAQQADINYEQLYRMHLVKKFYEELLKKQLSLITNGKKATRIKFDSTHATLMVDVLQKVQSSGTVNSLLAELGSLVPPKLLKNEASRSA
jgi:hypothetical protein